MRSCLLPVVLVAVATGCPLRPPELLRGPDRPDVPLLGLLDPAAEVTVFVRPAALLASPLGSTAEGWFEPTPEDASRGGPAQWFRELGGAEEALVSFLGEDDPDLTRAARGGEDAGRTLALRFAERADAEGASAAPVPCADVTAWVAGTTQVAAVGAELFVAGPQGLVDAACRRAAGRETASLAADPRTAPLLARLDFAAAQIAYVGRVPAPLRPRLRHWGLDPLVDRVVVASVSVAAEQTAVRLVADVDDEASAAALVQSATEGLEFAASRRSFQLAGLSRLIRQLAARSDGRFFFLEGNLPTPVVAVVLSTLRTVEEAAPE